MKLPILFLMLLSGACANAPPAGFDRTSDNPIEEGRRLSLVLGCNGCHGNDLTGRDWSDQFGVLWTANLTRSAETNSRAAFSSLIVSGRRPDRDLWDMPSYLFTQLTPGELDAVVSYSHSVPATGAVHPPPAPGPELQKLAREGEYLSSAQRVRRDGATRSPDAGPNHRRAQHMVRATCAECHRIDLRGGTDPIGGKTMPDLVQMAAAYTKADFERLLTTGIATGGREVGLMTEVATGRFRHLTPSERAAIFAYLQALSAKTAI